MAVILIADDDSDYRAVFREGLEMLGHTVHEADSADAVRICLNEKNLDIAFLDIVMPGGGAVSLAHEIFAAFPELPFVVITGHAELYDTPLFREGLRRARAVLRKTTSLHEINRVIGEIV